MATDAARQLRATFGDLDERFRFLVCTRRDFSGRWFADVDEASSFAEAEARETDVYLGVSVRREDRIPPRGQRGAADTVDGIPGLWIDVDVAGPAHGKKGLPATMDEARRFVANVLPTFPPSLVVFSGHGLQAWWLFSEAWIFETPEDRAEAKAFLARFAATVRAVAAASKIVVDPVFDLARVFRLAGTWNRKTDPPIATILERPAEGERVRRYEVDDLDAAFVLDDEVETGPGKGIPVGAIVLDERRRPPEDALLAMVANDEKIRATWERRRTDLRDSSASSYDFALAIFAARAGWSDQEIADLLVAWRVKHGERLKTSKSGKVIRLDYYQRTIRAARAAIADERDEKAFDEDDEVPLVVDGRPVDTAARAKIFEKARGVFGLPIVRFVQNGDEEDARFSFALADGRFVALGGGGDLEDQRRMRGRIYPIIRRFPKSLKPKAWSRLWEELGAVCETITNEESGREGRFAALLYEYLSEKTGSVSSSIRSESNWKDSVPTGDPFVRDGRLFVCVTSIESFARTVFPRKTETREIWAVLGEWGFENGTVKVRQGGREIGRKYWSIPIDDLAERKGFTVPVAYLLGTSPGTAQDAEEGRGGTHGGGSVTERGRTDPRAVSGEMADPFGDDFGGILG
jgi:hypothetical protein